MEEMHSHSDDEFGSVYSFDGLYQKLRKHSLAYPATSPNPSFSIPLPLSPRSSPLIPPLHTSAWGSPLKEAKFYVNGNSSHNESRGPPNGKIKAPAVSITGFRRFSVFSQPQYSDIAGSVCGDGGEEQVGEGSEEEMPDSEPKVKMTKTHEYKRVRICIV